MVMYSVSVDKTSVDAMLNKLARKISGPGLAFWLQGSVVPWLQTRAQQRFASEGDDVSGAWFPLKPFTQQARAAAGYTPDHPINVRTGELERYITGDAGAVAAGPAFARLDYPSPPGSGDLRDKVETAQIGKAFPSTPARPVLGVNIRDLEAAMLSLALYIEKGP
jgi:hypothetical protein